MNKILIKRAFKSLFKNKLFMALMFILILISSATYTLFQSSSGSFKSSYDKVVTEGKLHDAVIKENFKLPQSDEVIAKMKDSSGAEVDINEANLKALVGNVTPTSKPGTITQKVDIETTKQYPSYGLTGASLKHSVNLQINVDASGNIDWTKAVNDLNDRASEFAAEITFIIEQQLSDSFTQAVNNIYSTELSAKEMKSITVSSGANTYKVVQYNEGSNVNQMISYEGSDSFTKALTNQQMIDELKTNPDTGMHEINALKGYKVQAIGTSSAATTFVDTSAYQAIVSPTYAQAHNIKPIGLDEFNRLMADEYAKIKTSWNNPFLPRNTFVELTPAILARYSNSYVMVDQTPYLVIGIGTTPDMSYPIIDIQHPTVNTNDQAIVFVNNRGYERIVDGFRTNPQENYISVKFNKGVSDTRKAEIKRELETIVVQGNAATGLSAQTQVKFAAYTATNTLPTGNLPGLKMVTDYNDKNDQYTLTYERIAFLESLQKSISTISWVTTTMLVVFVSAIVLMVFKVLITSNRKQMATMLALGYSKTRIAFTTALISFAVGTIPAALGYVLGHFLQAPFTNAFADFWTLPTHMESFSWISLLITVGLPTLLLFFLIAVVTVINIRHTIPDMLRDSISDNSHIVAKMVSPFKFIGIKTKYAISLVFRNAGKLALTAIATTISALALLVGASTIGASDKAYSETVAVSSYEYKVDLTTPTVEGGEYKAIRYNQLTSYGHGDSYASATPTQTEIDQVSGVAGIPRWHVPTINDGMLTEKPFYLDNMIQSQVMLETPAFDAWKIATSLMPENQLNTAKANYTKLFTNKNGSAWDKLTSAINDSETKGTDKPFLISYRNPIIDNDDETYTYIDTDINTSHGVVNYHVTGLNTQNPTSMYHVDLNKLKNAVDLNNPSVVPVFINKYMSEYYNWSVGSTFGGSVNNSVYRNFITKPSNAISNATYKVVGIIDGYGDSEIITAQDEANKLLGLSSTGFNGVMTKHQGANAAILNSLPLYAPSGMYFGTDTLRGPWDTTVTSAIQGWTFKDQTGASHQGSEIVKDLSEYYAKYSRTPYISELGKVNWKQADKYTFESVSKLSGVLINTISAVSIALSIIFTAIVTSLIIRTNRKRISTLWTLGYRKREILKIFMANFILPLAISIAVAIPVAFGILEAMRVFIMNFGHILIPFELAIWSPFVVIALLGIIFFGSTWISIASLSSGKALHAFKED